LVLEYIVAIQSIVRVVLILECIVAIQSIASKSSLDP
jgi:hypothetical protein